MAAPQSPLSLALDKAEALHRSAAHDRLVHCRQAKAEIDRLVAHLDSGGFAAVPATAATAAASGPMGATQLLTASHGAAVSQLLAKVKARLNVNDAPSPPADEERTTENLSPSASSSPTPIVPGLRTAVSIKSALASKHPSSDAWVAEAVKRKRLHGEMLEDGKRTLARNRLVQACKLHLQVLSATVRDVCTRMDCTPDNPGPRLLLEIVRQKAPDQVKVVAHVIADKCVNLVMGNVASDAIKHGETSYALAYMALVTAARHAEFSAALRSALEYHCPYVVPGLIWYIAEEIKTSGASPARARELMGYLSEENDAEYLLRMQAMVAWYAALLQTRAQALQVFDASVSQSPFVLAEAWRFLAGTLNHAPFRWTRYILQAFLAVAGSELCEVLGKQMIKLAKLCLSPEFVAAHNRKEEERTKAEDSDRHAVFELAMREAISRGAFEPPGRVNPETGQRQDPRLLPDDVSLNVG